MQRVRIFSQNENSSRTRCYVGENELELKHVTAIDFHISAGKIPTFTFETIGAPDIDMQGNVRFEFTPETVGEAVAVLRTELLKHDSTYYGFLASITSALKEHQSCNLPFEPEKDVAKAVLDRIIGEEQESCQCNS